MPQRLPGLGAIQRRKGRNELIVSVIVRSLRDADQYGPREKALATLARTLGASLDRIEWDSDRSEHNLATVARVQLQVFEAMRPDAQTGPDSFDELIAALRDPAPS